MFCFHEIGGGFGRDGTAKTKGLLKPDKFALIWGYAENKSSIFGVLKTKGRGGAI